MLNEILNMDRFAATGPAVEILKDIGVAIGEIDARRPLPNAVVRRLESEILADRVHSSAVTEGNRLSRRETLVVLSSGVIEAGSRKDSLEVRNLAQATLEMERALAESQALTSPLLRHLQGVVLQDIERIGVGKFRTENVAISGAAVQPPHFHDVPELVEQVLKVVGVPPQGINPVQLAAWAHWAIARIHPFRDGNGRVARLVQDYVLLSARMVPAPLRSEDREGGYYAALERADKGDGQPLLELVSKNVLRMADRYLSLIRDEEAKASWVANIAKAANEKVRQTSHRRFLAVQRSIANLKREFQDSIGQLDQAIPNLRVRMADYGDIAFEKFQEIERSGSSKKTWLFGVEFRLGETVLRYVFWYASHHSRAMDPVAEVPSKVVVLVSMQQQDYYVLLDQTEEDRVSLREVVPSGPSLFWRRRYNPTSESHEWDYEITGGSIARDFLQEVLSKLGLI